MMEAANQDGLDSKKTVTVVFSSPDDGSELFRVDFPGCVFVAIKRGAKSLGVSLDKFFELATVNKIGKAARPPATIPTQQKVHKGFFQINMSQSEQRELRALAAAFGIELRGFLSNAVRHSKRELEQALAVAKGAGINPQFVYCLTASSTNNN